METEILKWLFNQGGGYVLVAFLFYFYRRDIRYQTVKAREEKEQVLKALLADVEVSTRLTKAIDNLSKYVEHCEVRRINHMVAEDEERRRKR